MIKEFSKMIDLLDIINKKNEFFSIVGLQNIKHWIDSLKYDVESLFDAIRKMKSQSRNRDKMAELKVTIRVSDIEGDVAKVRELLSLALDKRKKFDPIYLRDQEDAVIINKGSRRNVLRLLRESLDIYEKVKLSIFPHKEAFCELDRAYKDLESLGLVVKDLDHYLNAIQQRLPSRKKEVVEMINDLNGFLMFIQRYVGTLDYCNLIIDRTI